MTTSPRIGITAKSSGSDWVDKHVRNYMDAITRAGGTPIVLAPSGNQDSRSTPIDNIDGLLLSGGGDVHPRRYGQDVEGSEIDGIDDDRDELELRCAKLALDADLPILAICRGLQVLNVAMGGQLLQHIDGHRCPGESTACEHLVSLYPETRLRAILGGREEVLVNSHHHQAVTTEYLAPGLGVSALSLPDAQIVEATESTQHSWVVAVQWHPEKTEEVTFEQQNLFAEFVARAARESRTLSA